MAAQKLLSLTYKWVQPHSEFSLAYLTSKSYTFHIILHDTVSKHITLKSEHHKGTVCVCFRVNIFFLLALELFWFKYSLFKNYSKHL